CVLKQPDCPNPSIAAEIEPVPGAPWNANQISGFNFNANDRPVLRVNMKQAAPGNNETDLVFFVPMFTVELRQHRLESRGVRRNIDDVGSDVATTNLQSFDLVGVCAQNLVRRRIRCYSVLGFPVVILDATRPKICRDWFNSGNRAIFVYDSHYSHFETS